jgi:hypothetical protein
MKPPKRNDNGDRTDAKKMASPAVHTYRSKAGTHFLRLVETAISSTSKPMQHETEYKFDGNGNGSDTITYHILVDEPCI